MKMPTLGGRQVWTDVLISGGWRVQCQAWTGHCRVLDSFDRRRGWGHQSAMERVLGDAKRQGRLAASKSDAVVLVHGLGRTAHSLDKLAATFRAQGFEAVHFNYASTQGKIEDDARALSRVLAGLAPARSVSFVTHSLGALVVRRALAMKRPPLPVHRVVMLAPPNQGSRLAAILSKWAVARIILGPVLTQLTPSDMQGMPAIDAPFMIVAGTYAPLSWGGWATGKSDGLVRVQETELAGALGQISVRASHTFIMNDPYVIAQCVDFIQSGFEHHMP